MSEYPIPEDLRVDYEWACRCADIDGDSRTEKLLIERIAKQDAQILEWKDRLRQMTECRDDLNRLVASKDAEIERLKVPRMFPVQNRLYRDKEGKTKPGPPQIPWEVAEKVYAAYSAKYGTEQSLAHLGRRGGFGLAEMDMLYPQWREDTDELAKLRNENASLKAQVERLSAPVSDEEFKRMDWWPMDKAVRGYFDVLIASRAAKEKP